MTAIWCVLWMLATNEPTSQASDEASTQSSVEPLAPSEPAQATPLVPGALPAWSFSTPAGSSNFKVKPGLDVFGWYTLRWTYPQAGGNEFFHRVDLGRGHASLFAEWMGARGRFVLEAVRSAAEGSWLGVAGDSLVLRAREAWAGYRYRDWLEGRFGVVPTLSIQVIESVWMLRAVSAVWLEQTQLLSPADLGGTLVAALPWQLGWIGIGAYNGEGYNNRELNRGKNVEVALTVTPLATLGWHALEAHIAFVSGSQGVNATRADRLTTTLLWRGATLRAGATLTYGFGVDGRNAQQTFIVEGFTRYLLLQRVILGARVSHWQRDVHQRHDFVLSVLGSVGVAIVEPLELHLVLNRQFAGPLTRAALPGSDQLEARFAARVVF